MDGALTINQFISLVPQLHAAYLKAIPKTLALEQHIQQRALRGFLDKDDLKEIAIWDGNAHSAWQKLRDNNPDQAVRSCTAAAIAVLSQPESALRKITKLRYWGTSFGSKTLAMLSPSTCPVLDSVVRECLSPSSRRSICYEELATLCRKVAQQVPGPNAYRPGGAWLVRDVEMAIFQFGWPEKRAGPGGKITGWEALLQC